MKRTVPLEDYPAIAREAKALVALVFRNGPIEDVHAGKPCPTCHGNLEYSHITQAEMRLITMNAVDRIFSLLLLKQGDSEAYEKQVAFGARFTTGWDEPNLPEAKAPR
jgi:hypothetical protein